MWGSIPLISTHVTLIQWVTRYWSCELITYRILILPSIPNYHLKTTSLDAYQYQISDKSIIFLNVALHYCIGDCQENNNRWPGIFILPSSYGYIFAISPYWALLNNWLKLYIKNMVCIRCQMAVKSELEKLGLHQTRVELGETEIMEDLSAEQLK